MTDFEDPKKSSDSAPKLVLGNFGRDLVKLAEEGKLDPVVGRDKEIDRIIQVLSRRKKNNPLLLGEPGCGKTAIIEGLALRIAQGDCPLTMESKRIMTLELSSLVAGTKYRGQFEERLKVIVDELKGNPNVILFIDEIHTLVGAGNSSGALDAANILKPALANGEIRCIGATTLDEFREKIEKDGAMDRRFQKVFISSPTKEETLIIIKNSKEKYEEFHSIEFTDEVLSLCVNLADRYITNREFPDKAFDLLDEIGARSKINISFPDKIKKLKDVAKKIKDEKILTVKNSDYEKAAELRDKEKKLIDELKDERDRFERSISGVRPKIDESVVYEVISEMTKIPLHKLTRDDSKRLLDMEKNMAKTVVGQDEAIAKVSKAVRRNKIGIRDRNRPIGNFIFLGPPGMGKTFLAKSIAKEVFGSEDALIRIDMGEFQEGFNASKLIGAPPGYVGYTEGGGLTEKVKNNPYSVVLFDEIEKAHKSISTMLLKILDEGFITDSMDRKIDFRNTLIIFTSNLGTKKIQEFGGGVGFNKGQNNNKDIIEKEVKNYFPPEFLNRLDDIVIFNTLEEVDIKKIIKFELNSLNDRLSEMNYSINFHKNVVEHILKKDFKPDLGARPIRRAVQETIEDHISDSIIRGEILKEKEYNVSIKNGGVVIAPSRKKATSSD